MPHPEGQRTQIRAGEGPQQGLDLLKAGDFDNKRAVHHILQQPLSKFRSKGYKYLLQYSCERLGIRERRNRKPG
jgi:hypothetical protein